jgi:L-iditol 2-dehydrogenase
VRVARTLSAAETVLEEHPELVPGPGEVVCRILACATCGSDVQDWYVARKLPAVLGHEPVGEVTAIGEGVTSVAVGDRVAIHHHTPCGTCARCRAGHETLCPSFRTTNIRPGGFAEAVLVEAALVPELLPLGGLDPVTATFTEPLACALRGQGRAGLEPDDRLLVVGAGCSGLLQIAAARVAGVRDVRVAEPDPERLARAQDWGAAVHVAGDPVDVAIACTPRPDAIRAASEALDAGGRLLVYAPPAPGTPLDVDAGELFLRELTVTASWSAGPADMRASLGLLQSGAVQPLELVQLRVGLQDTGRALAAQRSGAALKAVVEP